MGLSKETGSHTCHLLPACLGGGAAGRGVAPGYDSLSWLQDVDTAFLINSDLEINVEALIHELDFLKTLYTEVPAAMLPTGGRPGDSSGRMMGGESSCPEGPLVA